MNKIEKNREKELEKIEEIQVQIDEIVKQHILVMKQVSQVANLQADIAKQVVAQHHETEALMKGLGLKKDLSYYSFNLYNEEGH